MLIDRASDDLRLKSFLHLQRPVVINRRHSHATIVEGLHVGAYAIELKLLQNSRDIHDLVTLLKIIIFRAVSVINIIVTFSPRRLPCHEPEDKGEDEIDCSFCLSHFFNRSYDGYYFIFNSQNYNMQHKKALGEV
jgi:hypothetical protein